MFDHVAGMEGATTERLLSAMEAAIARWKKLVETDEEEWGAEYRARVEQYETVKSDIMKDGIHMLKFYGGIPGKLPSESKYIFQMARKKRAGGGMATLGLELTRKEFTSCYGNFHLSFVPCRVQDDCQSELARRLQRQFPESVTYDREDGMVVMVLDSSAAEQMLGMLK